MSLTTSPVTSPTPTGSKQVYNRNAAQAVKADIDRENKDREILAASGWTSYLLISRRSEPPGPAILYSRRRSW